MTVIKYRVGLPQPQAQNQLACVGGRCMKHLSGYTVTAD